MVTSLNDPLNLKDYISLVVDFIKRYSSADQQPRTIVGFLTTALKGIDFRPYFSDVKDAEKSVELTIVTLQKLFSGNVHYSKVSNLSNDIISGKYDREILKNISEIEEAIEETDRTEFFYSQLSQLVSKRFFSTSEFEDFTNLLCHREYGYVHLIVFKHGFNSLFNIQCFFADRMYEEALTYDFDSPLRYALMRTAAEGGNKQAALEYGNYIAKAGPYQEAFSYLIMAFPLPSAIWNAAYLIENHQVGEEQANQLRTSLKVNEKIASSKEFDEVRNELDSIIYTGNNPIDAKNMLICYSVYFYLAYRGFYKAFNSMAKMLIEGTVSVYDSGWELTTTSLCEKYWAQAISGGNLTAISNVGNRQFRKMEADKAFDKASPETQFTEELLVVAASMDLMRANYNLGNYYEFAANNSEHPPKTRTDIAAIYQHAADLDKGGNGVNGNLHYRMAFLENDSIRKNLLFELALHEGKHDASYYLALSCFEEYEAKGKKQLLLKAQKYLKENIGFLSLETKSAAKVLFDTVNSCINEYA